MKLLITSILLLLAYSIMPMSSVNANLPPGPGSTDIASLNPSAIAGVIETSSNVSNTAVVTPPTDNGSVSVSAPEPTTLLLLASGLTAGYMARRKQRQDEENS